METPPERDTSHHMCVTANSSAPKVLHLHQLVVEHLLLARRRGDLVLLLLHHAQQARARARTAALGKGTGQ